MTAASHCASREAGDKFALAREVSAAHREPVARTVRSGICAALTM